MRSKIKICLWQKKIKFVKFSLFLHKSIVNASIWCQKTSRSVCQHFWMKSKSLVFGGFLDLSGENGSNIVNNQLTGLILLCKVFETSSQSSKCLLVLPYQWAVRNKQNKFHWSLVFPYLPWNVIVGTAVLKFCKNCWTDITSPMFFKYSISLDTIVSQRIIKNINGM